MTNTGAVVVGVDSSWRQTGAVEWALDEALRTGAALHVVHVVDDRYGQLPYLAMETARTHADELVSSVAAHLRSAEPTRLTADAVAGSPGVALAHAATQGRMLVLGRSGAGALTRLLVGSTAEKAVASADRPVVVVPDAWRPAGHRDGPVVTGVDVAAPGAAALEFAFVAAAERHVPLRLLACWDVPAGYVWDNSVPSTELAQWRERTERLFAVLVETWRDKHPDVMVQAEVRQGHPVAVLLDDAAATGAQLLVVGGRAHNRVAAAVLGSVARGVLHRATSPVAVVHDA